MDIGSVLMQIADKLGIAANQIFEIYVKGQKYEAISYILEAIVLFFFVFFMPIRIIKNFKRDENTRFKYHLRLLGMNLTLEEESAFLTISITIFILIVLGIILAILVKSVFLRLTVPEYIALKELLRNLAKIG